MATKVSPLTAVTSKVKLPIEFLTITYPFQLPIENGVASLSNLGWQSFLRCLIIYENFLI